MSNKMDTLISLKAEIQAQIEGQDKIQKFCFEDINIGSFQKETVKLLSRYTDLTCLEFNHCKLSQLENLIGFKNVVKLRLCDNDLDKKSLLHIVEHFPNLKYLDLSGNKITCDDLKILAGLKDLTHLIVQQSNSDKLFNLIPSLCVVDHKDKEGNEIDSEDDDEEEEEEEESDYDSESECESSEQPIQKKTKL